MQRFRKILVVLSPSANGWLSDLPSSTMAAIERAVELGQVNAASITLVAVVDPSANDDQVLAAQNVVDLAVEKVVAAGVSAGGKLLRQTQFNLEASENDFDLVIVGDDRPDDSEQPPQSVTPAVHVLTTSPIPVLVVRPSVISDDESPDDFVPTWLTATTLDENGFDSIQVAVNGAQVLETRLIVLHAFQNSAANQAVPPDQSAEETAAAQADSLSQRELQLHDQLAQTDFRTIIHGVSVLLVEGEFEATILQTVAEHNVDLVILGCADHKHRSASMSQDLLSGLGCSILVLQTGDSVGSDQPGNELLA